MAKFNKILKEDVSLLLKEDGKDGTYVTKSLT